MGYGWSYITHGYLHKNTNMTKKVKSEYIGQYVTIYNGNFETSFTVTEETANEAEYLFEDAEPKSKKYKAVENESNEA